MENLIVKVHTSYPILACVLVAFFLERHTLYWEPRNLRPRYGRIPYNNKENLYFDAVTLIIE
jgi:hypothetical protein